MIERAVETARPLIDAHGHKLVVRMPKTPVRLFADPVRLHQQQREHGAPLLPAEIERPPLRDDLQRAEDPELHATFVALSPADRGTG